MKHLFFFSVLIIAFGIVATAQQSSLCPDIKVTVSGKTFLFGEPMPFSLLLDGRTRNLNLEYKWMLSEGGIDEGQNTSAIIAQTAGLGGGKITATVEIKGLPEGCPNTYSAIGLLEERRVVSDPAESYSGTRLFSALNRLAKILLKEAGSRTFIIVYLDNASDRKIINRVFRYLNKKHGIAKERIIFGIDKKEVYSGSVIPLVILLGVDIPECKGCEIIRGEELKIDQANKTKLKN